ncbi:MAG: hypothetical protein IT369_22735 [Candidatus Latescibacteria bacterium]|nr:hypothetical protein [Candidatus Latescibacterota bacterium]
MATPCFIDAPVITEALLRQHHQGQEELRLLPGAVITPTGWDYLRQHRVKVSRGEAPPPAPAPAAPASGHGLIPEMIPSSLVQEGRYDHPDRSCGCQTEEFGSGFVEPASCGECSVHHAEGGCGEACQGCNRHQHSAELQQIVLPGVSEDLVRQIVVQVLANLGQA